MDLARLIVSEMKLPISAEQYAEEAVQIQEWKQRNQYNTGVYTFPKGVNGNFIHPWFKRILWLSVIYFLEAQLWIKYYLRKFVECYTLSLIHPLISSSGEKFSQCNADAGRWKENKLELGILKEQWINFNLSSIQFKEVA